MVVKNYIVLTLFLNFHNVAQLLGNFYLFSAAQAELAIAGNQFLVADHHGHPVISGDNIQNGPLDVLTSLRVEIAKRFFFRSGRSWSSRRRLLRGQPAQVGVRAARQGHSLGQAGTQAWMGRLAMS